LRWYPCALTAIPWIFTANESWISGLYFDTKHARFSVKMPLKSTVYSSPEMEFGQIVCDVFERFLWTKSKHKSNEKR